MLLNHLDLQVPDVRETAAFFEAHFGFRQQGNQGSPAIAILMGDGPFTLVLQHRDDSQYPEGFHLGFIVETPDEVHARHAQLRAAGVDCSDVQVNGRGTMTYLRAPGGVLVEVSCRKVGEREVRVVPP